jgi:2,4-dienoyl-CoA reductase-like NADH-dependent reductase (Old Yellow Enzyme family)
MSANPLFTPFHSKTLSLQNRIVMAPMTRSKSPGGTPTEEVAAYYRQRAEGGVGLIITEGTTVNRPGASNDPNVPNFHTPESLQGWQRVVQEVHAAGGKIAPQLWHMGMVRKPGTGPYPEGPSDGPSGLSGSGKQVAEPMSEADIASTISAFADAAERAKEIGFDAVELHGAHGYLLDQFFWDQSNRRSDQYGGDLVKRTRFASEIVQAVRDRVGSDFTIILRFSQWKQQDYAARLAVSPTELAAFLEPLTDAGVDIFHCSTRRFWEPEFEGSSLNLAGWTKKLTGKPTITVGSVGLKGNDFIHAFKGESAEVGELGELESRLQRDEFDLVAVGRALITDPNWPAKVRDGKYAELSPFTPASLTTL